MSRCTGIPGVQVIGCIYNQYHKANITSNHNPDLAALSFMVLLCFYFVNYSNLAIVCDFTVLRHVLLVPHILNFLRFYCLVLVFLAHPVFFPLPVDLSISHGLSTFNYL